MAARQAKGRATSGRYKKHDTARKNYIETVALPALRLGKRIDAADWRRLFLPGDDEIHGPDKADMDIWYKKHYHDPRSSSSSHYQLDESKQRTLFEWISRNAAGYVRPKPAPSGAPPAFKLSARENKAYAGCTLAQLAADGNKCALAVLAVCRAPCTHLARSLACLAPTVRCCDA